MVQYILENIFSFTISVTFMILALIFGLLFLIRGNKQKGLDRYRMMAFGLILLFFSIAHGVWTYRTAYIPQHPGLNAIFPYWQSFWILFMVGVTFIGIWSLLLSYPEWFSTRKWIIFPILVPWLVVTLDVLLLTNPITAEWVCTGQITDIRPDFIVILVISLSLTVFTGLAINNFYSHLKEQENRFNTFLTLFGLLLILIGGILETRVIPICQVITVGRIMMLIGLLLVSYRILSASRTITSISS